MTSASDKPRMIRLSKVMAHRGLCSRREADAWIERGWVRVNGKVISELGSKVTEDCEIELLHQAQRQKDTKVTILLNKPVGYVCSPNDDGYPYVLDIINESTRDQQFHGRPLKKTDKVKLGPVGRLDIDSTGLVLLTQDGTLAKKVIGENSSIEKEYLVRYSGSLTEQKIEKLRFGITLDNKPLKRAQVQELNEDQLQIILTEGKKRQIRRMLEAVDLQVTGLKRVRIGDFTLGKLQLGQWRYS